VDADGDFMTERNSGKLRQSSYNIIVPLSSHVLKSDKPLYILANPLYGNTSLIDEKEYEILQKFPEIDEGTVVSDLRSEGYITNLTDGKERKLMEERYEAQKKPKDPRASFVITYQCNLRCTYCWSGYLFSRDEKCTTVIDEKTVDAGVDVIPQIPALQSVKYMSLYGGEPFLASTLSIVRYILEKGSERGYAFHANTNGTHLKLFAPLLAQHDIAAIGVTLDGCADVHNARRKRLNGSGTFHRIVGGIDTALDEGIPVGVRINVDAENLPHLPAFGDWIKEHGWAYRRDVTFAISLVRPGIGSEWGAFLTYPEMAKRIISLMRESPFLLGIMPYEWEYITEGYLSHAILHGAELQPRPFYCSAHCQGYAFDLFGDIYSCPRAVGDRRFSIGRFVPTLQFNENYEQWFHRDVLSIPTCRSCDLALLCGGGCAYEGYLLHDTIYEGYCERYRAFIEYGMPLFVRRRMWTESKEDAQ